MSDNVKINVNGLQIESEPNKLLIEACEDSGIHIPRFCWHKRLDPVGMCRMCLVEIETPRGKMLVPSCTTEVSDEMGWKKVKNKEFPQPMKFGNSINSPNRWSNEDIQDYLNNLRVRANARGGVVYEG